MPDDTSTIDEERPSPAEEGPVHEVEEAPGELPAPHEKPDPVRDRLLLPLLLPLGAMAAIAVYVLNISRVFLAGGSGAASVVTGVIVTVAILAGAAAISASPRLRSSTLMLTVAVLLVLVVSAGLITLGPSEGEGEGEAGGFVEPKGPPDATLVVEALPSIKFDRDEYTTPGGILEIDYSGAPGHTLVFEEPEFEGFKLALPGGPKRGKVEIEAGEHVIYCDIPGHRDAGMEAALVVTTGGGEAPPEDAPVTTGPE